MRTFFLSTRALPLAGSMKGRKDELEGLGALEDIEVACQRGRKVRTTLSFPCRPGRASMSTRSTCIATTSKRLVDDRCPGESWRWRKLGACFAGRPRKRPRPAHSLHHRRNAAAAPLNRRWILPTRYGNMNGRGVFAAAVPQLRVVPSAPTVDMACAHAAGVVAPRCNFAPVRLCAHLDALLKAEQT